MLARAHRLSALASLLAIAFTGVSGAALAQGVSQRGSTPGGVLRPVPSGAQPMIAQPVIQAIPGSDGMTLDAALGRLARDPRDIGALIDAGNAALVMGDVDAATGFFRRADQVSPGNPRVKAGLAGAMVHNGDPFGAIPLFDEAEKAGALDTALAADRGLAYDLVGDNVTAQRYYRQALARGPSEEVTRRLALSLAISGDRPSAEQLLSPMLLQRNLAAWRTRAFALAILGQTEEAVSVANSILPADLAGSVAPYLRYMPRLTHAQQAAAANFGSFPRASEIGRDDPRVALYAPKRTAAAANTALVPQGEPLGHKARGRDRKRQQAAAKAAAPPPAAPPELSPTREVAVAAPPPAPAPLRSAPPPGPPPARTIPVVPPTRVAAAPLPAPTPTPSPAPTLAAAPPRPAPPAMLAVTPGFSIGSATQPAAAPPAPAALPPGFAPTPVSPPAAAPPPTPLAATRAPAPVRVAAPAPVPTPAPAPPPPAPTPPPAPPSLADAFAEFGRPSTDATPAAGAVDLRGLKPAAPPAKKPAEPIKPPPPSHPSRIWVQVATGRDKAALGYDWRRMTRQSAEVMRGKAAFLSAWGQTNRLLTGPFQSEAAANSFIAQLRKTDIDGAFVWTSPAGQVVDELGGAPTAPARR